MTSIEIFLTVGVFVLFSANIFLLTKLEHLENAMVLTAEAMKLNHKILEGHTQAIKRMQANKKEGQSE